MNIRYIGGPLAYPTKTNPILDLYAFWVFDPFLGQ